MNPVIQHEQTSPVFFVTLLLACVGLLHVAQAVVPPPDGGYPGGNTAEGQGALFSLTTGSFNTAIGWYSPTAIRKANLTLVSAPDAAFQHRTPKFG